VSPKNLAHDKHKKAFMNDDIQPTKISLVDEAIVALDQSLHIMSHSPSAANLLGVDLRVGQAFPMNQIWQGKALQQISQALQDSLEKGVINRLHHLKVQHRRDTAPGMVCNIYPVHDHPDNIIGIILSFQIMADQRSHALSKPHEVVQDYLGSTLHKDLFESLPEGVFTITTDLRIASFNRRAQEITGFSCDEVIGRHCWEIFRSELCQLGCPLKTALQTGKTCVDQDVRILKKGGARQTILVNVGVLRNPAQNIIGAVETFRPLIGEAISSGSPGDEHRAFAEIVGQSNGMQRIFNMLPEIAASDANVLLSGESGTGKDLVAYTIHAHSSRHQKPFVAVNCAALPETLLESELFGHEKGAFTGAEQTRAGRFERAHGGTLYLDEICELKPELQIKLLRVLEQHEFERVGGTRTIPMEARIISATNRDLRQAIEDGVFREDFYYRLRTVPLHIPPLRERIEDIPSLMKYFIQRFNQRYQKHVMSIHTEVMRRFKQYEWPGNVRELERTLEYAYVFVKGPVIRPRHLPPIEEFQPARPVSTTNAILKRPGPDHETIRNTLSQTHGNRLAAAQLLGVSRTTLWRYMKKLGIDTETFH
jgi:PAS domain S-box-containing protein